MFNEPLRKKNNKKQKFEMYFLYISFLSLFRKPLFSLILMLYNCDQTKWQIQYEYLSTDRNNKFITMFC